jgi:mRNA interferase MazF
MTLQRGDIVLATLPFTDLSASKIRPALVVQSDRNNQRLEDVILAMITRTTHRATMEPTQLSHV